MQLDVSGLKSGYGKVQILHGVDFCIRPSEITTVLGPNGAGKSTLMKTISGHLPAMAGDIRYRGESLAGLGPLAVCKAGVGYVPQDANVFPDLSVYDNLLASSLAFEGAASRMAEVLQRFPILEERANQLASTLSGGERQTLAIGTALVAGLDILILDEPTAGLAPIFVDRIVSWVRELAEDGMGVVWVVEQNPEKILAISETAYVIDAGRNSETVAAKSLLEPGRLEEVLLQVHV
ncbi:ABC transporter ATP-binding protein [Frigidibacter sp. ROC022]|uniref:ABC transporter ATP-binding protein n=1 Tax=Frigidibacter sp. ROC022 TaxID=2971796 RepID=UPI00215A4677|nr:ABC transporter ATP-binding protein [Frigidibacter sp. ROC022]MCR8726484.1 ABC transporter ATP-binding protein [Frigidibacter sp. ROC022]